MISGAGNVLRSTVSRLLAKDAVFHRVQQALLSTRDLRRAVDRNVGRLFAGLNIPSHQEVDRLYDDIRALEKQLSALTARTEALVSALDPPPDR